MWLWRIWRLRVPHESSTHGPHSGGSLTTNRPRKGVIATPLLSRNTSPHAIRALRALPGSTLTRNVSYVVCNVLSDLTTNIFSSLGLSRVDTIQSTLFTLAASRAGYGNGVFDEWLERSHRRYTSHTMALVATSSQDEMLTHTLERLLTPIYWQQELGIRQGIKIVD